MGQTLDSFCKGTEFTQSHRREEAIPDSGWSDLASTINDMDVTLSVQYYMYIKYCYTKSVFCKNYGETKNLQNYFVRYF